MNQIKIETNLDQAFNKFCTAVAEDDLDVRELSIAKLSWLTGVTDGVDLALADTDHEAVYIYCAGKMSDTLNELFADEEA